MIGDSFSGRPCLHETWRIHAYGTWLIYMGHDSFIWDTTHSYGTCLIQMGRDSSIRAMPHTYMGHDSFSGRLCANGTCEWVMYSLQEKCSIWMSNVPCEWMSHVPYEWGMSHTTKACHISMGRVTYERVIPYAKEPCHMWMSHVMYEWGNKSHTH